MVESGPQLQIVPLTLGNSWLIFLQKTEPLPETLCKPGPSLWMAHLGHILFIHPQEKTRRNGLRYGYTFHLVPENGALPRVGRTQVSEMEIKEFLWRQNASQYGQGTHSTFYTMFVRLHVAAEAEVYVFGLLTYLIELEWLQSSTTMYLETCFSGSCLVDLMKFHSSTLSLHWVSPFLSSQAYSTHIWYSKLIHTDSLSMTLPYADFQVLYWIGDLRANLSCITCSPNRNSLCTWGKWFLNI